MKGKSLKKILYKVDESKEGIVSYVFKDRALHRDSTGKGLYTALEDIVVDVASRESKLHGSLSSIDYDFIREYGSVDQSLLDKKVNEAYSTSSSGDKYFIVVDGNDAVEYKNIVKNCLSNDNLLIHATRKATGVPSLSVYEGQAVSQFSLGKIASKIQIVPQNSKYTR